jgi:hypothetical protein
VVASSTMVRFSNSVNQKKNVTTNLVFAFKGGLMFLF